MSPVIKVENLSKEYRLGATHARSFRELANSLVKRLFIKRHNKRGQNQNNLTHNQSFWALRDINFEVQGGEVIGILGRNGAGKSTLLKILGRITPPTHGRAELRGRVASLLEVGTGFHPELTGRENVYMNGTILGMTKREIDQQFDNIVSFSDIAPFIDTPVKRYSSGMTVRLGFAVAAHLNPEILIVDEVLAVGDTDFQSKCIGKMQDVAASGRTVIFVSHQLPAVERLTQKCIVLDKGQLIDYSPTSAAIRRYLKGEDGAPVPKFYDWPEHYIGSNTARINDLEIRNEAGDLNTCIEQGKPFEITLTCNIEHPVSLDAAIVLESADATPLFSSHLRDHLPAQVMTGATQLKVKIDTNFLKPGNYNITTSISTNGTEVHHAVLHYPALTIKPSSDYIGAPPELRWGSLIIPYRWTIA